MPLAELPQQPGVCNSIPAFVTRHLRVLRTSEATSQQNCPDYCDLFIISDIRRAIFLITGRISLRILRVCYLGYSVKIFYTSNPNDSSLSQKLQTFMWTLSCFTLSPCPPTPTPVCMHACAEAPRTHVRGQLPGTGSLSPPCGLWDHI